MFPYKKLLVPLLALMISPVYAASISANIANCNVSTFSSIALPVLPESPTPPLNPPQLIIESATVVNSATLGQYCDVIAHVHTENLHHAVPAENAALSEKEIQIEVKLPTIWNTKYLQYGGGGFDGSISAAVFPGFTWLTVTSNSPLSATYSANGGYVIAATDSGHFGGATGFKNIDGTRNVDRWINYGYRSRHILAITSKMMINQYYGSMPTLSYHGGFSKGGASSLAAALRYPNDFDGIVAGAPGIDLGGIAAGFIKVMAAQFPGPCTATTLSACLATQVVPTAGPNNVLPLIAAAVMNKCDAEDGLSDGVISSPQSCSFDVRVDVPTCTGSPGPSCLTLAQKNVMHQFYSDDYYGRFLPGYENDPGRLLGALTLGATPTVARTSMYALGEDSIRHLIYNNLTLTLQSVNLSTDISEIYNYCGPGVCTLLDPNAFYDMPNGANLSAYQSTGGTYGTGGKLLVWHGTTDALISPAVTINWYNSLAANMGGMDNIRKFARLFLVVGQTHTSLISGSAANTPSQVEVAQGLNTGYLHALESWVETGVAPDQLIGTNTLPSPLSRPICAYPYNGVYIGAPGDTAAMRIASNWECRFYDFKGLKSPLSDMPVLNSAKAGQSIPVKFSLGADWGLNIMAVGYPKSEVIACNSTDKVQGVDAVVMSEPLSYEDGQYKFVWKTDKSYADSCRQLVIRLNEGTTIRANFNFK